MLAKQLHDEKMSQKQTRKIINWVWSGITLFLLIYSWNTFATVQWAEEKLTISFPLPIFGKDGLPRDMILYIGIPVILILLLVLLYLSNAYYDNSTKLGDKWNQRVPIFLDLDINMKNIKVAENRFVKNWNRLSIISLIFPYLISLHQLYKFFRVSDKAFLKSGDKVSIFHPTSPFVILTDQYRYGGQDGWTFFPLYIPILFIALELIVFFYLYKYLKKIKQH